MDPLPATIHWRLSTSIARFLRTPLRISKLSASASRFAVAMIVSLIPNSTPLNARLARKIGSAARYRLTPHAFMTVSSLVFVSRPMVTRAATSAETGSTK